MTKTVFKKLAMALSLSAVSFGAISATPALARDHYRAGDYYRGHDRGYDRGYDRGRHYNRDRYYSNARYYQGNRYYARNDYRYRCRDNGTGGAIIGAIAGGLLGNEVAQRGDKTTGAVLGAAIGAVAGHAIDKSDGRRC